MSPAFFAELAAARAARRPMVWRRPFGRAAPGSGELFTWLSDAWRHAEPRPRLRLYGPAGQLSTAVEHAPVPADGSVRGWLARLEDAHGECGVVVNSAFGCHVAPPPGDTPLAFDVPARAAPGAVVVRRSRDGDVVWGAGGEVFRYPALRPLVELLRRVAGGAPFVPAALVATLADGKVAPDALAHVLELIHAHHALVTRGDAWNLHVVPGAPHHARHDASSASFHSAASR